MPIHQLLPTCIMVIVAAHNVQSEHFQCCIPVRDLYFGTQYTVCIAESRYGYLADIADIR